MDQSCCSWGISSYSRQLVTRSCTSAAASMHCSGSRSSLGMSLTVSKIKASAACCGRARTAVCQPWICAGTAWQVGTRRVQATRLASFQGITGNHIAHCTAQLPKTHGRKVGANQSECGTARKSATGGTACPQQINRDEGQPAGPQHTNQDAHSCIIRARRICILPKVRVSPGLAAASLC